MIKLQLGFGGGIDDILLSLKQKKFFSYEKDRDEIHELFGGKAYYTSRSGDSGSGWINQSDLVRFGYYRTDARDQQGREVVHTLPNNGEIFGYMPIISHGGIDQNSPVVLTDGKIVIFSRPDPEEIINWLLEWGKWDEKRIDFNDKTIWNIEKDTYDYNGNKSILYWYFINFHHYKGVRATRFLNLKNHRHTMPDNLTSNLMLKKLGIFKAGDFWLHVDRDELFDDKFDTNPRTKKGEIINRWEGFGNGVIFRRRDNKVECFIELDRQELSDGKWWIENETPQWIDYEYEFSVIEFFSKTEEEITEIMIEALIKKAKEDYIYARKRSGADILNLMKRNPETYICVQDSLDSGNCLPGTESFINRFNITVNETGCVKIESLLNNKEIMRMVKDFNFQKVVYRKLNINEVMIEESEEMKEVSE